MEPLGLSLLRCLLRQQTKIRKEGEKPDERRHARKGERACPSCGPSTSSLSPPLTVRPPSGLPGLILLYLPPSQPRTFTLTCLQLLSWGHQGIGSQDPRGLSTSSLRLTQWNPCLSLGSVLWSLRPCV